MLRRLILIVTLAGAWLAAPPAMAQSEDQKLSLIFDGLVADGAGVLSPAFKEEMKERLPQIKAQSGISVVLVTAPGLQGASSGKLANDVGEKLQNIGEVGKHWVVFILVPADREFVAKLSTNNPAAAEAWRNGDRDELLERSKRFAESFSEAVTSHFKDDQWEAGLRAGIDALINYTDETRPSGPADESGEESVQAA